jgi:hypothetical protein
VSRALLAAALALACVLPARSDGRARRAELELHGPLAEVAVETGPHARLVLHGALAEGEELRTVVLLPVPERGARGEPRIAWEVGDDAPRGRARFVRWIDAEPPIALPPALRARVRAPVELARSEPTTAALVLLVALACALVGLRSRPRTGAALAVGLGLVAAALARAPESALRAASVLEGKSGASTWLEVRSAAQALELPDALALGADGVLEIDPPHAPLRFESALRGGAPVVCRAPRARLHWVRPVPAPELALPEPPETAGANGWRTLEATWTRAEEGWSAHGPWTLGAPLPAARPGADPPGWLRAGLPQGVPVLLGAWSEAGAARHVRVTGG